MSTRESGFSLVEVIIAMFLLMVLALAVLPLTISATRTSVVNRDLVAATAFASAQLAPIKAEFGIEGSATCSELAARATPTGGVISDPAGTGLTATLEIGACPTDPSLYPATVAVTVEVRSAAGRSLVAIPTLVLVSQL